jgi:hypothetical protein
MAQIKTSEGSLYLYVHWHGSQLPEMAVRAVEAAKPRLGDESYWVRIVLDQLTKDGRDQETGFGIMLQPNAEDEYNGDHPSVIIDAKTGDITLDMSKARHKGLNL